MGDTNYIGSIVRILEKPIQTVINDKIIRTDFRVQLVEVRNIQIVSLVFWGNLGQDILNNSQLNVNDYIMVEGYLSLIDNTKTEITKRAVKKAQITVLKAYAI